MKILFLSSWYPPLTRGGGEISTHLIAKGLIELGHTVDVVASAQSREEGFHEGVKVLRLPTKLMTKPLFERRASKRAAHILKKEIDFSSYDLVHAHDFRSTLVLAELKLPNSVTTSRDYAQIAGDTNNILRDGSAGTGKFSDSWRSHRIAEAKFPRKIFRWWQYAYNIGYRRKSFSKMDGQIFISEAQKNAIGKQQVLEDQKTTVIFNPVSDEFLGPIPSNGKVNGNVLYVGTVEDYKGVKLLLSAWREVSRTFPHAKLKIVGVGSQKNQYEAMVERMGMQYSVLFAGGIPWNRLMSTYDESSVVVAPHLWLEPFGRTVVEAMAREKIVVTSNVGGPSEVVDDNITGFLFEVGSKDALIKTLITALEVPDIQGGDMRKAARDWVMNNLTQEKIALLYEKFYYSLKK